MLATYLNQFPTGTPFLTIASDFHFLVFIATMDVYPLKEYMGPLLEAVKAGNQEAADDWAASEHWLTVCFTFHPSPNPSLLFPV